MYDFLDQLFCGWHLLACRFVRWPGHEWFHGGEMYRSWNRDLEKCGRRRWHGGDHAEW